MRLRRLGLELRVTLHRHEPRVARQLDHLDQLAVRKGKERPFSYSTVEKTFYSFFIYGDVLDTPLNYRMEEGTTVHAITPARRTSTGGLRTAGKPHRSPPPETPSNLNVGSGEQ
jgi:hypothetical protein